MKNLSKAGWLLSGIVITLGFIAWGQGLGWRFSGLSGYDLFPLFGITAFSLMWSVYIVAALQKHYKVTSSKINQYYKYISALVLLCILLHPGILIWQLWKDGLGLPPKSYLENYVAVSSRWAVILGMISLFIFLLFEFHRKYGKRNWWKYVQYASDAAMVGIFFHALKLGPELQEGWFRWVWIFYGASFLVAVGYMYLNKGIKTEDK